MSDPPRGVAPVPGSTSLRRLEEAASGCQACELYRNATQTVFGTGPDRARVVIVGEQPGDMEDRRGEPFVGPAGRLLNRALDDADLPRAEAYVTNAVKHFKFRRAERGNRRIHQKPDAAELAACRPWLRAELYAIRPEVVVVLGATAASTVLGSSFRVTRQRGQLLRWSDLVDGSPLAANDDGLPGPLDADTTVVATVHPSAIVRIRESDERSQAYDALVSDLRAAATAL